MIKKKKKNEKKVILIIFMMCPGFSSGEALHRGPDVFSFFPTVEFPCLSPKAEGEEVSTLLRA